MESHISEHHPLRQLFGTLTEKSFAEILGWADFNVTTYLSNLLVEFAHIDQLHRIKNQEGKSVETVIELLYETEAPNDASAVEREREVHRQIGDFTLFMTGIFPEYLSYIKAGGLIFHKDFLVDYVKAGKRSYRIVASFQHGDHGEHSLLFDKLSTNFELCVAGLGVVRQNLDRMKDPAYRKAKNTLLH